MIASMLVTIRQNSNYTVLIKRLESGQLVNHVIVSIFAARVFAKIVELPSNGMTLCIVFNNTAHNLVSGAKSTCKDWNASHFDAQGCC